MFEGKDYLAAGSIFPFLGVFADRFLGSIQKHEKTTVHTMHTQLVNMVTGANPVPMGKMYLQTFWKDVLLAFKLVVVYKFSNNCEKSLFSPNLHPLDHMAE